MLVIWCLLVIFGTWTKKTDQSHDGSDEYDKSEDVHGPGYHGYRFMSISLPHCPLTSALFLWLAVHTEPEKLLYDGRQAVTFGFFYAPRLTSGGMFSAIHGRE